MHLLLLFMLLQQTPIAPGIGYESPSYHAPVRKNESLHSQNIPGPIHRSSWAHRLLHKNKGCYLPVGGTRQYFDCRPYKSK